MNEERTDSSQKALIYCRVSDPKQKEEGHGLESQEQRCRDHAAQRGYEVEAVFPDVMTGGGDFLKRPGMVALLAYLDARPDENFVVVFDDLKRYARDTEFHLQLKREMSVRNAQRECLNFKFEDSPEGDFIETVFAAHGELERRQNGRQVKQKMRARMKQGYWAFRAPVGYVFEELDEHGKLLVRDEPNASIIQEAFEGLACGRFESRAEVKRFLDGFPTMPKQRPGGVGWQFVSDLLSRPIYAGLIDYKPWSLSNLPGKHQGLISLDTFERVQSRLKGRSHAPARKNINRDFVLRGACSLR